MEALSDNQQNILFRIKTRGPQTVRALAEHLGMTSVGARQHLLELASAGYVTQEGMEARIHGRGRPVRPWRLTSRGHARFPDAHADVTVDLIASVRDTFGEQGLETLIEKRTARQLAQYREVLEAAGPSLPERLAALARLRTDEGYMCEVKALGDDAWLLIENHCPICAAATACQSFCRSELEVFRSALGAGMPDDTVSVERVNHMLSGARRCAYRVS